MEMSLDGINSILNIADGNFRGTKIQIEKKVMRRRE